MPTGVRVTSRPGSREIGCRSRAAPAARLDGPQERPRVDVVRDGRITGTVELRHGGRYAEFLFSGLPGRMAAAEPPAPGRTARRCSEGPTGPYASRYASSRRSQISLIVG
ncbi:MULTISPECIES: hypothetical protein [unclassified Streptomyces]|uniref:hypothetical protein n=1 Tax=unclassified Streptomyces TaxID=2593676 RepID=UPI0033DCEA4D